MFNFVLELELTTVINFFKPNKLAEIAEDSFKKNNLSNLVVSFDKTIKNLPKLSINLIHEKLNDNDVAGITSMIRKIKVPISPNIEDLPVLVSALNNVQQKSYKQIPNLRLPTPQEGKHIDQYNMDFLFAVSY